MLALFARLLALHLDVATCEAVTDAAWERCGGRALEVTGHQGADAGSIRACYLAAVPETCWPVLCAAWQGTDYDCETDR